MSGRVLGVTCAIVFWIPAGFSGEGKTVSRQESPALADRVQEKIDRVRNSGETGSGRSLGLSEIELESYVYYRMTEEIPARIDAIDVSIEPGRISASTELFFDERLKTGNAFLDLLISGPHTLFLGAALSGQSGVGAFELQEVRVDGVPVPLLLIDALVDRFVIPDYPEVDLDQPFALPWGIEQIELGNGEARIRF